MGHLLPQSALYTPRQNQILAGLPPDVYERMASSLELVPLAFGSVLYESGAQLSYIYFPVDSIVSLVCGMKDGATAEIAVVGNEGMLGVASFMGGQNSPNRAVVLSTGYAYRLSASLLRREFELGGPMQHILLRYIQALNTMMAQIAACNRHHSVEQQLCRWLLSSLDRLASSEICVTQELIANMLGVRREGVTEAAGKLLASGIINYRRGHITVVDRHKLETRVCECYSVVSKEFERLLPARRHLTFESQTETSSSRHIVPAVPCHVISIAHKRGAKLRGVPV